MSSGCQRRRCSTDRRQVSSPVALGRGGDRTSLTLWLEGRHAVRSWCHSLMAVSWNALHMWRLFKQVNGDMTCDGHVQPKEMPFCLARLMTIGTRDVSGKDDAISMARTMCSPEMCTKEQRRRRTDLYTRWMPYAHVTCLFASHDGARHHSIHPMEG